MLHSVLTEGQIRNRWMAHCHNVWTRTEEDPQIENRFAVNITFLLQEVKQARVEKRHSGSSTKLLKEFKPIDLFIRRKFTFFLDNFLLK